MLIHVPRASFALKAEKKGFATWFISKPGKKENPSASWVVTKNCLSFILKKYRQSELEFQSKPYH